MVFYAGGFAEPAESYSANMMVIITAVGTMAHHIVDFIIAYAVGKGLASAKMLPPMPRLFGSK